MYSVCIPPPDTMPQDDASSSQPQRDADEEPLEESQAEELYEGLTTILESNEEEPVDHVQWPELDEVATKLIAFLSEADEEGDEEETEAQAE